MIVLQLIDVQVTGLQVCPYQVYGVGLPQYGRAESPQRL
jgi:hypothetical protein